MATITKAQIKAAFALAEAVYDGRLTFETAAAELRDQHGLNINSARDFIGQYRHMLRGEVFKRLEVHHKEQLARGGKDTVQNAVAVCPTCHRQQHHGEI